MQMRWFVLQVGLVLAVGVVYANAEMVVHDDFDDEMLGACWFVTYEDSYGWVYEETNTSLTGSVT